jgi:4-hydroxythreonine-4-phosphate dehydrogenase
VDERAGRLAAEAVLWGASAALRGEVAGARDRAAAQGSPRGAGLPYPGHTELLQAEAAAHAGVALERMPVRMMLANDELRTVLREHPRLAARGDRGRHLRQRARDAAPSPMRRCPPCWDGGPRIAVAGLNPHAGEGGLFGREEIEVIVPALRDAQAAGMEVHGPFAPDTVFMRARPRRVRRRGARCTTTRA